MEVQKSVAIVQPGNDSLSTQNQYTYKIGSAMCPVSNYGFLSKNRSSGRIGDLPWFKIKSCQSYKQSE